ncbi:hypothetical protein ACIGQE_20870 [Streptomyces sp. NPDC053429]|uniref:hypothetical protein n=1 Tax=Streptomyces sp. NPDC053429 TaxID=3365702 RepID=UPI0037CF98E6
MGLTRVYLGVPWFSDVVGGWLFAAAWLALTDRLRLPMAHPGRRGTPRTEADLGPAACPGRGGRPRPPPTAGHGRPELLISCISRTP